MDDTKYWASFYNNNITVREPSDFCKFISDYIKPFNIKNILDCGCGNGRDSYFLGKNYTVTGIDTSSFIPEKTETCNFEVGDFCNYNKNNYDLIYSRFTFHSITNKQHKQFLNSIQNPGTLLCIETRSDKGKSDKRHHGDEHFRNFTNIDYIKELLEKYNFEILYIKEDINFAIYKEENPVCIRVICKKK